MLNILLCVPNLSGGGAERMVLTLAAALDRKGLGTRLFIHERWGQHMASLAPGQKVHFQHERPYRRKDMVMNMVGNFRQAGGCDVVIGAIEGRATITALFAGLLRRRPVILWVHCDWSQFSTHVSWRQRLALQFYRFADRVVCCSLGAQEAFATLVPAATPKLTTIYNGVGIDEVQRLSQEAIEAEHEVIFEKPVTVAVGRLDVQKGFDILIRAHAQARASVDCNLVIIGEGPLHDDLLKCARDNGVADSVFLIGFQKNPFRYMRRAHAFAMSSRFEGFALVLVEAMACGTAVISTSCPSGPAEVLDHGRFGLLVEPENPAALATSLVGVLIDPAERRRLSALALERCRAFDIGASIDEWVDLLVDVAASRSVHHEVSPARRSRAPQ
jgi:glycosyltransferase involved in cell wall biosynthesis